MDLLNFVVVVFTHKTLRQKNMITPDMINNIYDTVFSDQKLKIREIDDTAVNISYHMRIYNILREHFHMKKLSANSVCPYNQSNMYIRVTTSKQISSWK